MIYNDKNMLFEYSHGYIPGWLYFDKDGIAVTGLQQVWGEYYYFRDAAGLPIRVQGEIVDTRDISFTSIQTMVKCGVIVMPILMEKIIILMKTATLQRFKSSINCN